MRTQRARIEQDRFTVILPIRELPATISLHTQCLRASRVAAHCYVPVFVAPPLIRFFLSTRLRILPSMDTYLHMLVFTFIPDVEILCLCCDSPKRAKTNDATTNDVISCDRLNVVPPFTLVYRKILTFYKR